MPLLKFYTNHGWSPVHNWNMIQQWGMAHFDAFWPKGLHVHPVKHCTRISCIVNWLSNPILDNVYNYIYIYIDIGYILDDLYMICSIYI
jgi:hypothetical protein